MGALAKRLIDSDDFVRRTAAVALGRLGPSAAAHTSALAGHLHAESVRVSKACFLRSAHAESVRASIAMSRLHGVGESIASNSARMRRTRETDTALDRRAAWVRNRLVTDAKIV